MSVLFELELLSFVFNADPDPAFHSNADPDPSSQISTDSCGTGSLQPWSGWLSEQIFIKWSNTMVRVHQTCTVKAGNFVTFFAQIYFFLKNALKGQCHEIFCFWFSFPPAPEYSIKTVSNFFENSRRYSQLRVCHRCQRHRWQMEKIFK